MPNIRLNRISTGSLIISGIIGVMIALLVVFLVLVIIGLNIGGGPEGDSSPSWSADGSKVAFASDETGDWDIYVMNADGSGRVNLTLRSAADTAPSWSPDGQWIAFISRESGRSDIHRARPDGTGLASLTVHPAQRYTRPIYSHDGSRIAFTSNRDADPAPQLEPTPAPFTDDLNVHFPGSAPHPEIYVMNADGSGQTRLTFNVVFDGNPSWSPDGRRLAYQSREGGEDYEIFVVDIESGRLAQLTDNEHADVLPAWSPVGDRVAFSSNRPLTGFGRELSEAAEREFAMASGPSDFDIYVMKADGSDARNWTVTPSLWDSSPSWSPDGEWIAFEARPHLAFTQSGAARDIYVMRLDEDNRQIANVTNVQARNVEGNQGPIVWSPDGRSIAFVTSRFGTPRVMTARVRGE